MATLVALAFDLYIKCSYCH